MKRKRRWIIPLIAIAAIALACLIYTGVYYHADETAIAALASDESVTVTKTEYGWFFDGVAEEDVLVFYPGGKVEETAYAPLLHRLAAQGMDVCLLKVPLRLAVLGTNRADDVPELGSYAHRYVGGHSVGGAVAAIYAAGHGEQLSGVILLAAYPTKALDNTLLLLEIYGSEDGVLNTEKLSDGSQYAPERTREDVIEGGNHAQFGNYGIQKGDGPASISAEEQQTQTVECILSNVLQ